MEIEKQTDIPVEAQTLLHDDVLLNDVDVVRVGTEQLTLISHEFFRGADDVRIGMIVQVEHLVSNLLERSDRKLNGREKNRIMKTAGLIGIISTIDRWDSTVDLQHYKARSGAFTFDSKRHLPIEFLKRPATDELWQYALLWARSTSFSELAHAAGVQTRGPRIDV